MSDTSVVVVLPQLRDFTVERRLGVGTYAAVYKAHAKHNPADVCAIKCIRKNGLNKSSTENLLREIQILKQIKHDYVVQLRDFQWDDTYIYLIMEYCPGGDLSTFIKSRRTIPERYVRRFVQQIACALKHLHASGIAHMDLKPQNILLTSVNNPSLKLADFGFAQYMREDKVSKSLRGSPLYMAPEILKCKVYDSKVDLWSVGVILHEVIFGYAPFVSNSLDELEQKIMDDTPIHIPTHIMLSETCRDLLRRLLQRNPAERISFEQFFAHPFVDLEHMASSHSWPKACELLAKATKADEKGLYLLAQRYYLQSIEYLIPAIQYEKSHERKEEIREKAKIYMKRAEELADIIKPKAQQPSIQPQQQQPSSAAKQHPQTPQTSTTTRPAYATQKSQEYVRNNSTGTSTMTTTTTTAITGTGSFGNPMNNTTLSSSVLEATFQPSQITSLLKMVEDHKEIYEAIRSCLDADEKFKSLMMANGGSDAPIAIDVAIARYDELFEQYESSLSVLFASRKTLAKESEISRLLKQNMERWLCKAECVKAKTRSEQEALRIEGRKRLDEVESQTRANPQVAPTNNPTSSMSVNAADEETSSQYTKQCTIS